MKNIEKGLIEEDEIENDNEKIKKGWFISGIITIIFALGLPFTIIYFSNTRYTVKEISSLGAVGDFFGGSTIGLLSIASIFFIIHTIRIQSKELELQRKELKLTNDELKKTREQHEENNKTMLIQRFETTFFNMLSLHREILNSIEFNFGVEEAKKGRKALLYFFEDLTRIYSYTEKNGTELIILKATYEDFFDIHEYDLGHYFRNLYRILKFVDDSILTDIEKKEYIGILRAQLSKIELQHVFYNCLSSYGENLKQLVVKYNFFENLSKSNNFIEKEHFDLINQ